MADFSPMDKRLLRRWVLGVAAALVVLAALPLLLAAAALQGAPTVVLTAPVDHNDVARAMRLLRQHDPRRAQPGRVGQLWLAERDIDVLLGHAGQRWLGAVGRARLDRGAATLQFSAHLPARPLFALFGRWLNVELHLAETEHRPTIVALHIGRLRLPGGLVMWALPWLADRAGYAREAEMVADVVRQVRFAPRHLMVRYAWGDNNRQSVLASLLRPEETARLAPYQQHLVELTAQPLHWQQPLTRLLQPLLLLAAERGEGDGQATAAEYRSAIVALTLYATGRGQGLMPPELPRPRPLQLTLGGRGDLALHFLVSATLAVEGTTPLAQAIGLYKEIADSRGGSGFSFIDLAANQAGRRFGRLAVNDPHRLHQALLGPLADGDLLPPVADLPEFLNEAEFKQRFGGVGEPPYQALVAEIERRVSTLPLLR